MKKAEINRNYGIDVLRVLATLFVLIIHLISPIQTTEMSSAYIGQNILSSLVVSCINIFGLISGYLCWNREFKWGRAISLHMTVLFYSVVCTICALLFVQVSKSDFIYSFIPLLSSRYWYFSAYIGMCFLIPFMNTAISQLDRKQGIKTIIGLFFAFTVLNFLKDGYNLGMGIMYGYSTMWLCVLYICGGIIAKFKLNYIISKRKWVIIGLVCLVITSGYLIIVKEMFDEKTSGWLLTFLYRYSSPTVFIMSLCLFMILFDIKVRNKVMKKVILFLSSTSFGVYILGRHWAVMDYIIESEVFNILSKANGIIFVLASILICIIFYFIFAVIEYIRQIFFKVVHCDKIMTALIHILKQ